MKKTQKKFLEYKHKSLKLNQHNKKIVTTLKL